MDEAVAGGRGRWGTAIGLSVAVLLLSVLDAVAVVVVPLALLLIALPAERRWRWVMVGLLLWAIVMILSAGPLALVSRGWALVLGAAFLVVSTVRPQWDVISRSLVATGATASLGGIILAATGRGADLDAAVRSQLTTLSTSTFLDLQERVPNAEWVQELRTAAEQIAAMQVTLFPTLVALQSVAALALGAWWVRRLGRSTSSTFDLARLRDFRFNDQLIWMLIVSVVGLLLPLPELGGRLALNALVFIAALYALRGLGIFVFLATESRSMPTMVLGGLAFIFLYPIALTAALLMGVGDTWLDVRSRVMNATPT